MKEQRLKLWQQWRRLEKRIRAKDELYDVSMLRGYHCKNDGYGELLPCFSKQLAEVLNINRSHKVLDVGSGIGFLCFDLACLSGCSVKGIEIRRDIYLKSVQIAKHVSERMNLDVSFLYGDGTADTIPFKNVDILVCCNTLWSGENNYRLLQKLCLQMRPGTRVVVLEQLGGQRYHEKSPRQQNDILSSCFHVPPQKFMSDPESVSWTSNPIPFYVYTKKPISREMKDKLEKDRGSVLKTPKHRTDPHVAEMAGLRDKKRGIISEEDDTKEDIEMPRKRTKREGAAKIKKEEENESEMEDSEMDSGEDEPTARVTRSAAAAAKSSKNAKKPTNSRTSKTSKPSKTSRTSRTSRASNTRAATTKSEKEVTGDSVAAIKKRRRRAVGVITSRIRRRTRAAIAKRQQVQQQRLQKQQEKEQGKEKEQKPTKPKRQQLPQKQRQIKEEKVEREEKGEKEEQRKTRSQTKAIAIASRPTLRSQVLPTTKFSSLPPTTRPKSSQIFDKARRRPTVNIAVNGMKVSERRSQRFKKFNMNLNDFIA